MDPRKVQIFSERKTRIRRFSLDRLALYSKYNKTIAINIINSSTYDGALSTF